MVAFIMTLASPEWKREQWDRVSEVCNNTLKSILNQTSRNFKIILVCNEPPINVPQDSNLIITPTDLPCPKNYEGVINDIYQKIKIGMTVAGRLKAKFVMRIDADDFVSNKLVAFTEKNPDSNGWYFNWGYCYDYWNHKMYLQPSLHMNCGTAHIIRCQEGDFPTSTDTPKSEWLECIWQHQNINRFLTPMNRTAKPLPFLGVIRSVNTGVNAEAQSVIHKQPVKRFITEQFLKKRITPKMIQEFALPVPNTQKNDFAQRTANAS